MDLKELESGIDPHTHWYYQSKKLPLLRCARRALAGGHPLTVVDIGSGSGFFARELEKALGPAIAKVYLVDTGYSEAELAATRGHKIEKTRCLPARIEHGLVVLMDVLEHLEDDLEMLQRVKAACVGGSNHFFITVPAFQALWSGHDEFLGHYRRYRLPGLRGVLRQAGFRQRHGYYLYGGLFPLVWGVRQLRNLRSRAAASDMRPFNPLVNKVLHKLASLEMSVSTVNRLFGVSCVGEGQV